jgi:fructuronate reductase
MVKLTDDYQQNAQAFKAAGIAVPQFDQTAMKAATDQKPVWVHFAAAICSAASMRRLPKIC